MRDHRNIGMLILAFGISLQPLQQSQRIHVIICSMNIRDVIVASSAHLCSLQGRDNHELEIAGYELSQVKLFPNFDILNHRTPSPTAVPIYEVFGVTPLTAGSNGVETTPDSCVPIGTLFVSASAVP